MSESSLGKIEISPDVIAGIALNIVRESYGVTGIVSAGFRSSMERLLGKKGTRKGVYAKIDDENVSINLHIAAGVSMNLAEVAANLKSAIVYQVEKLTGLHVTNVDIHVDEVKTSKS